MDIFLSINNRAKVLQMPVLPSEFKIQSPEQHENYSTVAQGEVKLIGNRGLKSISWSSIFPSRKLAYSRNSSLFGWDFVKEIEDMRDKKIPIRLIITDTNINLPVVVENFEYGMKSESKDVQYSIEFSEYKFLEVK